MGGWGVGGGGLLWTYGCPSQIRDDDDVCYEHGKSYLLPNAGEMATICPRQHKNVALKTNTTARKTNKQVRASN